MKLQELRAALNKLGVHPSRKLGQNFLIDPNTIRKICDASDVQPGDLVIEIGPGTGAMTELLLEKDSELLAIEYDVRLAGFLEEKYGKRPNFTLIQADAARITFDDLTENRPWRCNANLPYSVSTVIMSKIAQQKNPPLSMTLLLQKEMADRIAAPHGNKTYGSLSVRLQSLYEARIAGIVRPTVFWPPPEVDSAILTLALRDDHLSSEDYKEFDMFIKHCFAQRRKKLKKRLSTYASLDDLNTAFDQEEISQDARPEHLSVPQFIALFRSISDNSG